jgi:hypothetical protein
MLRPIGRSKKPNFKKNSLCLESGFDRKRTSGFVQTALFAKQFSPDMELHASNWGWGVLIQNPLCKSKIIDLQKIAG